MIFHYSLYFALRSGQEHRSLTFDQIELFEPDDGPAYLVYTENVSKNNTGGLVKHKVQSKQLSCKKMHPILKGACTALQKKKILPALLTS